MRVWCLCYKIFCAPAISASQATAGDHCKGLPLHAPILGMHILLKTAQSNSSDNAAEFVRDSIVPILSSAVSAWCASGGLLAPTKARLQRVLSLPSRSRVRASGLAFKGGGPVRERRSPRQPPRRHQSPVAGGESKLIGAGGYEVAFSRRSRMEKVNRSAG